MGWWEAEEGLLGDGPVDLLEDRLAEWTQEGRAPTWQQFLDALGTALDDRGSDLLSDPEALTGRRVFARFSPPGVELQGRSSTSGDRLQTALVEALEHISEEYTETQRRKPRLSEVLGTFVFSLRVAPERFLRNDDGWKLAAIEARRVEEPS